MVYQPKTMIGRCALAIWHQLGKNEQPLQEAQYILMQLRVPDPELCRQVAAEVNAPSHLVDLIWARMIDAIVKQVPAEEKALKEFKP